VASALLEARDLGRKASTDLTAPADNDAEAMAAGPLLQMTVGYFNKRSGGAMLSDWGPERSRQLGDMLDRMVLHLGFAIAHKRPPADLSEKLAAAMDSQTDPSKTLQGLLLDGLNRAAPAPADSELGGVVDKALRLAPRLLELTESFLANWDRLDSITVDYSGADGGPVYVDIRVLEGRQIRIDNIAPFGAALVIRGAVRLVFMGDDTSGTGETIIDFEPLQAGGAVEMHFDSLAYGLVRLLALPLDSAALREVRIASGSPGAGARMLNISVLMDSLRDRKDPRRILVYQQDERTRPVREAFRLRHEILSKRQVFSYVTPARRYTYERITGPQRP
jgi:hypothetical protein